MAEYETKDKEEAKRHKKVEPIHDQLKEAAEPEDSRAGQVKVMLSLQQTYGNRYVQRLAEGGREATLDEDIIRRIEAQRGSGKSLEPEVCSEEASFRRDFSQVRVYTDEEADMLSRGLNAKAFTMGRGIFFKAGTYKPNSEGGVELIANDLSHVIQQNKVAEGLLVQKAQEEEGQESVPSTAWNPYEVNVALYDANPQHMRQRPTSELPGSPETQIAEFRTEAEAWAGRYGTEATQVMDNGGIRTAIQNASAAGRIDTIACFGHGSSRSGWLHMDELHDILVQNAFAGKFSLGLCVILYMCLAGAQPRVREEEREGESAVEPGGVNSFAALLRNDLHDASLSNVEVWAHTRAEHPTRSPQWRVFGPLGEGRTPEGEPFFTRVFDEQFMDGLHKYLVNNREQLAEQGGELGDLVMRGTETATLRQMNTPYQRKEEKGKLWLWYIKHCGGEEHGPERARWAPMEPYVVARELRDEWLKEHDITEAQVRGQPAVTTATAPTEGRP